MRFYNSLSPKIVYCVRNKTRAMYFCCAGLPGSAGVPAAQSSGPSNRGFFFTRHSQSVLVPACPAGTDRLWDGYSLLHITGNAKAHGQDLGECFFS
jgi:C-terminal tandem repeated domain in type 4 procollagen